MSISACSPVDTVSNSTYPNTCVLARQYTSSDIITTFGNACTRNHLTFHYDNSNCFMYCNLTIANQASDLTSLLTSTINLAPGHSLSNPTTFGNFVCFTSPDLPVVIVNATTTALHSKPSYPTSTTAATTSPVNDAPLGHKGPSMMGLAMILLLVVM